MKKRISLVGAGKIIDEFIAANKNFLAKIDFVVGISRGGLVPAALLAARIDKPLAAAYIDKSDNIFFDRGEWINGMNIMVVDDVIRSGKTMWLVKEFLNKSVSPASVSFFTLFRVISLAQPQFHTQAFAEDVVADVIFPWDN